MNSFLKSALLAAAIAGICSAAQADTFTLGGTFQTGPTGSGGSLNGGSFSGTYDLTNGTVNSFSVFLRDASGTVLAAFTSADPGAGSGFEPNADDSSRVVLQFWSNDSYTNVLSLNFLAPFNGVGSVVPGAGNYSSYGLVGGFYDYNVSYVNTGASMAAAVPEPATWGLMGLGLVGVGAITRRRKAA